MGITNIEWSDYTFNHIIDCTKVSAGCKNCYAEADMDKRRGRVVWGVNGTRSVTSYSLPQVFLPYAITKDGRTVYEAIQADKQLLLPEN